MRSNPIKKSKKHHFSIKLPREDASALEKPNDSREPSITEDANNALNSARKAADAVFLFYIPAWIALSPPRRSPSAAFWKHVRNNEDITDYCCAGFSSCIPAEGPSFVRSFLRSPSKPPAVFFKLLFSFFLFFSLQQRTDAGRARLYFECFCRVFRFSWQPNLNDFLLLIPGWLSQLGILVCGKTREKNQLLV